MRRIARNEFRQAYFPPAKAFAINALEYDRANHAADRIDGAGAHVARGMQHVEGALEPRISDLRDLQFMVSHAVPYIGDRQYRLGDIPFDKLLDDLERVDLTRNPELMPARERRGLDKLPQAMRSAGQDERLLKDLAQTYLRAARSLIGRADQHQLILNKRLAGERSALLRMKREGQASRQAIGLGLLTPALDDPQLHAGKLAAATLGNGRGDAAWNAGGDGHHQIAARGGGISAQIVSHAIDLPQQLIGVLPETLSRLCGCDAAGMPIEQLDAELALEVADLSAERRLRDVQKDRCLVQTFRFQDTNEIAELPYVHSIPQTLHAPAPARRHATRWHRKGCSRTQVPCSIGTVSALSRPRRLPLISPVPHRGLGHDRGSPGHDRRPRCTCTSSHRRDPPDWPRPARRPS